MSTRTITVVVVAVVVVIILCGTMWVRKKTRQPSRLDNFGKY